MEIALFPLRTVLFPEGPLPLRIFEQRYLDMTSRCLRNDEPFGVVLIRSGSETGPAEPYDVGTLARITDWYQGSDGLLGVTATGVQRFRLRSSRRQADGLLLGNGEPIDADPHVPIPAALQSTAHILAGVLDDLGKLYEGLEKRYDDAGWVANRCAEILPITPEQKQTCLEQLDPAARLEFVTRILRSVRN